MAAAQPPAHPKYILRGHTAHIHSVRFVRQNTRLLTGDADGWVVFWKLETKRPLAVWHAHDGAILGVEPWGADKIVTHGRDNAIRVWQLRAADESTLSTVLPAEDPTTTRSKPWLLHTLPVNTLNFCALSMCRQRSDNDDAVLVAAPSTDDTKINVYQFPTERLLYVVPTVAVGDTGMAMAVKLLRHEASRSILVLSGYEGGLTAVHQLPLEASSDVQMARLVYMSKPHSQPVLSLDTSPDGTVYFTTSADAVVAAHRIPDLPAAQDTEGHESAPNPAQALKGDNKAQSVTHPSAELPDSTPPHNSPGESKAIRHNTALESSPLSFSKKPVSFPQSSASATGGLSSLLSSNPLGLKVRPCSPIPAPTTIQPAHKTVDTKHAGQQSLCVRSDGRIFATGGWDSRVRIYSARTLKEVAVLMWHKDGVYAVDFAEMLDPQTSKPEAEQVEQEVAVKASTLSSLQRQREEQMQVKHWIAAGSKDGKVSLWEVF